MDKKIEFELNGYIYISERFDNKNNLLHTKKYDKKRNFIENEKLKIALLPKKVKQKINPLKK
jgi:hypothetical protein